MDLKQLNYFVTVVNEGNITSAAKKLFMSQPPLSTQLKALESELGCVLIERGSRQVQLTDAGRTLYNYANTLLEISRIAKEEVQYSADHSKGTIRIGMVSSVVCSSAIHYVIEFSKKYPNMVFEIVEGNTYELLKKLSSNTIHCALVRSPYSAENVTSFVLETERLVAIGQSDLFDNDLDEVTLRELSGKNMIIYRRWEHIIKALFEENNLNIHCRLINDDARTTIRFAECGLGIGIVPESAIELIHGENMVHKHIPESKIESGIELVYNPSSYMPKCTSIFIEYLKS
ncbi:MAG: LysR family transcriptional regulator [Acutalibacteraceae bacterium]